MSLIIPVVPKIQHISLEITNHCNLSCWMCPHNSMTRDIGFMDVELVKILSPQIAELELTSLGLHGIGESLLHPKFKEYIEILRVDNPNLLMGLATNGTFLTRKNFDKTLGLVDEISIAIDGFTSEEYSKHRVGGDHKKVVSFLLDILEYRKELGVDEKPILAVQMIDLGQSQQEKDSFMEFWKPKMGKNDLVRFIKKASFGGQVNIPFRIIHCAALNSQVSILWDGRLTTCCWDSDGMNSMGDLNTQTINEIFFSSHYYDMRDRHDNGTLQLDDSLLCHTCLVPASQRNKALSLFHSGKITNSVNANLQSV